MGLSYPTQFRDGRVDECSMASESRCSRSMRPFEPSALGAKRTLRARRA